MGVLGRRQITCRLCHDPSQRERSKYLGSQGGEQTFPLFKGNDVGRP